MNSQSIGAFGIGSTIAGSLLGAQGAAAQGSANSQMYAYQAGIANLNQQIAGQNQEFAFQTGDQQALREGLKQGQRMGAIKTNQAASGFDIRSGSNAQVQASQANLDSIDTATIRSNAAKVAYGYQETGAVSGMQSELYTKAAGNAAQAGGINAAASILGGATSVANMWLQGNQTGMWNSNT
jgi:hypothetical protein